VSLDCNARRFWPRLPIETPAAISVLIAFVLVRTKADLLLHPVRLRVVQALAVEGRLSPAELAEELGDVAPATLYRHINALAEAGMLAAVAERPARGTPERLYALAPSAGWLSPEDLASASGEDHLRHFTMFLGGLLGDFARYLAKGDPDFVADGAGYTQVPVELTDREFAELTGRLNAALAPALANRPTAQRTRRMLTTIAIPAGGRSST
jgi:DNA-binding transcriptional ArsR family regulator